MLSYYQRNRARVLAGVKEWQRRMGNTYRTNNREQMRRARRRKRDRGQIFLDMP